MRKSSVWAFLLTMFLAVGAAVAMLPGCADDNDRGFDSDTDYEPIRQTVKE
jgi:hypothetical protein